MWTGDLEYIKGDYHFTVSSDQDSTCVVEPGTPEDVGKIVCSFLLASSVLCAHLLNVLPLLIISSK